MDRCKLMRKWQVWEVKIEVNTIKRGIIGGELISYAFLSESTRFIWNGGGGENRSVNATVCGKIAAARSRQHLCDLFDIKHMIMSIEQARLGFIFCLLGRDRPIHESFTSNIIDQHEAMEKPVCRYV